MCVKCLLSEQKPSLSLWKPLVNLYEYLLKVHFFSRILLLLLLLLLHRPPVDWVGSYEGFSRSATVEHKESPTCVLNQ